MMRMLTYSPPKLKPSTASTQVIDELGQVVCTFKRSYKNIWFRIADVFLDHHYFVQVDVYSTNGELLYQGKKIPRWGKTQYKVINCKTTERYHITYKSMQVVVPEFMISSNDGQFIVKRELMDWAGFYYNEQEVARWRMKTTELFKTYLQIEDASPIEDPAFFVCLFQLIFYYGE
ncbi:tubby C-terminal domain-like protein [Metabacillus niabensis]|uniref:Tubby C-terminal domain-containing protein n=2 Tax=Metabacillus niabensis TaxID=324854 RepID=A0ABT9Z3E8_9BACI|nr:hypothetical protein [Metabacillus niabensis]MDQ0226784.1 hypothetical protein [Metabacillus niabensis]